MNNIILRKQIYKKRQTLTTKERRRSALYASFYLPKLLSHLPKNAKIGLYLNSFGELPTTPIFMFCQKHGFTPFLPITQKNRPLLFAPVFVQLNKTPFKRHQLGMEEPHIKHVITADRLDVIICPLVAVDKQGNRLGMGGGFYDRTFAKTPNTLKVGYCYHFQVVDNLTVNTWDKGVDMAITDQGFLRF